MIIRQGTCHILRESQSIKMDSVVRNTFFFNKIQHIKPLLLVLLFFSLRNTRGNVYACSRTSICEMKNWNNFQKVCCNIYMLKSARKERQKTTNQSIISLYPKKVLKIQNNKNINYQEKTIVFFI